MNCYISKIEIINYKSIRDISISPNKGLSVFIGKNGAGKTIFLKSLQLLERMALRSNPLSSPNEKLLQEFSSAIERHAQMSVTFNVDDVEIIYYARFVEIENDSDSKSELLFFEESIIIKDFQNSKKYKAPLSFAINVTNQSNFIIDLSFFNISAGERSKQKLVDDFPELMLFSNEFSQIKKFILGIRYYSATKYTSPSNSPSSIEFDEKGVASSSYSWQVGYNHQKFLSDLYLAYVKDKDVYDLFLKTVSHASLELIDSIRFEELNLPSVSYKVNSAAKVVQKESKRKVVVPIFTKGAFEMSPSSLSEGTFKTLALIYYIIADKGTISLIEEPEVCVHHGLLANIIDIIKSYSYEKQIFLTTHSEVVLDSVDAESVFVVLWNDGSNILSLNNFLGAKGIVGLKKYLSTEGNLGEYIKHRDILNE